MTISSAAIQQHRVSRQQPCPVCQKTHGCLIYESHIVCLRIASDQEAHGGLGGWRHPLHDAHLFQAALENFSGPASQRLAPPAALDRVYRSLHTNLTLNAHHTKHLTQERQLTPEAIKARGYQSWGQGDRMLRSRLAQVLFDLHGSLVLDVPGFLLREQSRSYLTLGGPAGILIPVQNADGLIVAHQIRTDRPGDSGKYVWLSSTSRGGPGPGAQVHVARPLAPEASQGRVWLTEGPLKADIACDRLHELVMAIPGVQADKFFLPTLQRLQERGEIKELVIALDSDWNDKPAVAMARLKLAEAAARQGIPVSLADWTTNLKGLDDLLLAGGQPKLTPYQVSGNGKRPLEEVPTPPKTLQKSMSLPQARDHIEKTLHQALDGDLGDPKTLGILLNVMAGAGKSTSLTKVLNNHHSGRGPRRHSAYFIPRHDLADSQGRKNWAFLSGRTHANPTTGQAPCAYPERQRELSRMRIPSQMGCEHCPLLQACKDNTQPNPAGNPYYWGQFNQKNKVRIYPAQHFLTPALWGRPSAIVLDDCDLKSLMLEEVLLNQSQLGFALDWAEKNVSHLYAKAQPLLFILYELLRTTPAGKAFCWHGSTLLEKLQQTAQHHKLSFDEILDDASQAEEPDPFSDRSLTDGPRVVPVRFLEPLLSVLRHEWNEYRKQKPFNRRLRLERITPGQESCLRLTLRRELPTAAMAGSLLILADASLTLEEAQRLFPERRWLEVKPNLSIPPTAKIIQFPELNYGKVHLSKPKERQKALQRIAGLLEAHPGRRIGLITHQSFASHVRQTFPHIKVGHYYGQRGSNEFVDCDVLIVFGTPNPNPRELERQAEAIYWDQATLLTQTLLEPRTFLQRGETSLQTRVRSYADPRINELHRAKRDEELMQAIFRARPLSLDPQYATQLDLFLPPLAPGAPREEVFIYVFSSVPLNLEIQLQTTPLPAAGPNTSNVISFSQAAHRIWRNKQRITDQKIIQEAGAQRASVLAWKRSRPTYQVEAAPPPSQAPPWADVSPELIANIF